MNETKTQRQYVPKSKAKAVETSFGQVIKLGFDAEVLIGFITQNKNERGYINFDVTPRKQADDYGNTHSVVLNDWKPDANYTPKAKAAPAPAKAPVKSAPESDSVPF